MNIIKNTKKEIVDTYNFYFPKEVSVDSGGDKAIFILLSLIAFDLIVLLVIS